MPTQTSTRRDTSSAGISQEHAFRLSEASVALEGINPLDYPIYVELKNRVLAGEITSDQALDIMVSQFSKKQASAAA